MRFLLHDLRYGVAIIVGLLACGGVWLWHSHSAEQQRVRRNVEECANVLPDDIPLDHQFADSPATLDGHGNRKVVSVRHKLIELRAYCEDGVIYDRFGQEIRFYRMADYGFGRYRGRDDLVKKQEEEVQKLEQRYRVIRMYAEKQAV